MTNNKFTEALTIQDDIKFAMKAKEEIGELLQQWNDLHEVADDRFSFHFVDRKKEWEIIEKMINQFDDLREVVLRETLHQARIKQRELNERIAKLNSKFSKL